MFGKDSTPGGIAFQFQTIRKNGRRQREAFDAGIDPQTLTFGGKCENSPDHIFTCWHKHSIT